MLIGELGESFDVPIDGAVLPAELLLPEGRARGLVVSAQGIGRGSVQSCALASALCARGFATLVLDLLTAEEAEVDGRRGALRFDVGFLGRRLASSIDVLLADPRFASLAAPMTLAARPASSTHATASPLTIALLASGTASAASLLAAALRPSTIGALVVRGGRPDLAAPAFSRVRSPTLVCIGGRDLDVQSDTLRALPQLPQPSRMLLIPGASAAVDDAASVAAVGRAASTWFARHIAPHAPHVSGYASLAGPLRTSRARIPIARPRSSTHSAASATSATSATSAKSAASSTPSTSSTSSTSSSPRAPRRPRP